MQFIKDKRAKPIIAAAILILLSILIYLLLKASNSYELVSAKEFENILKKESPKELYIKDRYIFADIGPKIYKSAMEGLDKKEILKKYPVSIYTKSSNYLIYIAIFLLLSILVALLFILKRGNSQNPQAKMAKESLDTLSEDIVPQLLLFV